MCIDEGTNKQFQINKKHFLGQDETSSPCLNVEQSRFILFFIISKILKVTKLKFIFLNVNTKTGTFHQLKNLNIENISWF